jgi:arylsulfatase A-like enzyme
VQHVPLIISGPGVRRGAHSNFAARAIDIAPTIERLLGLPAIHRDGVILADALVNPSKYEVAPQRAIAPELNAEVAGLQQQSQIDVSGIHTWPALPPSVTHCVSATGAITCKAPPVSPTDG